MKTGTRTALFLVPLLVILILVNRWLFTPESQTGSVPPPLPTPTQTTWQEGTRLAVANISGEQRILLDEATSTGTTALNTDRGGLAGIVLAQESDQPLGGVIVTLQPGAMISTQTDEFGRFEFKDLYSGRRNVLFARSGRAIAIIKDLLIRPGELTRVRASLEQAQTFTVQVVALGGDGGEIGIEKAMLSFLPGTRRSNLHTASYLGKGAGITAQTEEQGFARCDQLLPGPYYAVVQAPGFPVWRGELHFAEGDGATKIVLDPGGTIKGRVLDSRGDVARGSVFLAPAEYVKHSRMYYGEDSAQLDPEGAFELTGVPEGEHELVALLDNGEVAPSSETLEVAAGDTVHVELRALATANLSGQVTDTHGQPLAGVELSTSPTTGVHPRMRSFPSITGAASEPLRMRTKTDELGHYQIGGVRCIGGPIKLTAQVEGYAKAKAYPLIEAAENIEQNFALAALNSFVTGRVNGPPGRSLAGVQVVAKVTSGLSERTSFLATTASDGTYRIAVPSAGRMTVMAVARNWQPKSRIQPSKIEDVLPESEGVDFELVPVTMLTIRAVTIEGGPVRLLEVSLFDDTNRNFMSTGLQSANDGLYRVAFNPERELFASVCTPGSDPVEIWGLEGKMGEEIVVVLDNSGEDVAVRVVDAQGRPLPGAGVAIAWHGPKGAWPPLSQSVPHARTNESGEALLRAVPRSAPREFLVVPNCSGYPPLVHFGVEAVGREAGQHLLIMPSGNEVNIRFETASGAPADGGCLIVAADGTPLTPRAFSGLRAELSPNAVSATRLTDGQLTVSLVPGDYTLYYQHRGALSGQAQDFSLTVGVEGNHFVFQVGN